MRNKILVRIAELHSELEELNVAQVALSSAVIAAQGSQAAMLLAAYTERCNYMQSCWSVMGELSSLLREEATI